MDEDDLYLPGEGSSCRWKEEPVREKCTLVTSTAIQELHKCEDTLLLLEVSLPLGLIFIQMTGRSCLCATASLPADLEDGQRGRRAVPYPPID